MFEFHHRSSAARDDTFPITVASFFQTILGEIGELSSSSRMNRDEQNVPDGISKEEKRLLGSRLCPLLMTSVECLQGGQSLQFTALLMINKMIDVMIIYGIGRSLVPEEEKTLDEETDKKRKKQGDGKRKSRALLSESKLPSFQGKLVLKDHAGLTGGRKATSADKKFRTASGCKRKIVTKERPKHRSNSSRPEEGSRRSSLKNILSGGKCVQNEAVRDEKQKWTSPLMILEKNAVDLLLNVLNNAITLHKRVQGCRQLCTPSRR